VKTVLQLYSVLKPPSLAAKGPPVRVRAELSPVPGGAMGRGNLPANGVRAQEPDPEQAGEGAAAVARTMSGD
jgi:hypothetical protein